MKKQKTSSRDAFLWADCVGGLLVGFFVLLFAGTLSHWEGLPDGIILFSAAANLLYGSYSLFVTTRRRRPRYLVAILSVANMCWMIPCVTIVVFYWNQITPTGIAHMMVEGVYVASLGFLEWRMLDQLTTT